jgi:uncharacterized protein YukE
MKMFASIMKRMPFRKVVISTLIAVFLTFNMGWMSTAQASTLDQQLVAFNLEETVTNAAKGYISDLIGDYVKGTQPSFDKATKSVTNAVNSLGTQIERAAKTAKPADQAKLERTIQNAGKELTEAAKAFAALADQTGDFDAKLQVATKEIVDVLKTDFSQKFLNSKKAFNGVSEAIGEVAEDTQSFSFDDVNGFLQTFGKHSKSLSDAIGLANAALKAFSS